VSYTKVVRCGELDCIVPLDVLAPPDEADLPTIVLIGGDGTFDQRRYLDVLAGEVARRGAVVFLSSYRSATTVNGLTDSLHDVRCSVRYARSVTAEHGGDPQTVVLVGHSYGSNLALQTAVTLDAETDGCLATGDGVPEAVVGLSEFHVASMADVPSPPPPVLLGGGSDDPLSETGPKTEEQLREAGFEAEYREFSDTGHEELIDPRLTPGVLDLIFEAVASAEAG